MILKAEASIDLDANRKVWIQLSGKTEPEEDPTTILPVLAESLVEAVTSAYDHAAAQLGMPMHKDPLRTFED